MIPMSEYAKRRKQLMTQVGAESIVLLPAAPELIRNGDSHYPYRQNSDFYYLTGFNEPQAVMVLVPKGNEGEYLLFNRANDPVAEAWEGPRVGQKQARKKLLVDQAFPITTLEETLPALLAGRKAIYYPIGMNPWFDKIMMRAVKQLRAKSRGGVQTPATFVDVTSLIHDMRVIKSPAEIAMLQKAIDISVQGHQCAMQVCHPGMNEGELDAVLSYEFKTAGAQHMAYPAIVGAGKNTCVLHYIDNNKKVNQGDLVLIDAGAEYENYAADITRTFPANGRFSSEQSAIYDIVLEAQLAAIKTIKPGASFDAAQQVIVTIITQGLKDLGILKGRVSDLIAKQAYLPFYMHRSGHWLGLDVHDAGRYKINDKWRRLSAGMVLTVEPGIYIASNIPGVHKRWHNIGVRIEDDVLVTKKSCQVLSEALPKQIQAIEGLMVELS